MSKKDLLRLYRELFKSLPNQASRENLRQFYQYTVKQKEQGNFDMKLMETYLKTLRKQSHMMELDGIGQVHDQMRDIRAVSRKVGLRLPGEK
ncbi:hypothetical protein pb186bvf_013157 [Paramecium bursaria]